MGAVQSACGVTTEGRQLLKAVEDGAVPDVDSHLHHNLSFVYWSTFSGGNTIWHKAAKAGQLGVLKSMARIVAAAYEAPKDTQEAHQMQVGAAAVTACARRGCRSAWGTAVGRVAAPCSSMLSHAAAGGHPTDCRRAACCLMPPACRRRRCSRWAQTQARP